MIYNPKIWHSSPLNICHNSFLFKGTPLNFELSIFKLRSPCWLRGKKDDECFGYPQAHQDTSSTPFFCSNSVEDKTFDLKRFEVLWGQEANWYNQQPPSTNSIYDNNIPSNWNDRTSDPFNHWSWTPLELEVVVWRCESQSQLLGCTKSRWPKTGKPNRGDEIPISLGKSQRLGWNIFEFFWNKSWVFKVRIHTWNLEACFFVDQWEACFVAVSLVRNLTCRVRMTGMGHFKMHDCMTKLTSLFRPDFGRMFVNVCDTIFLFDKMGSCTVAFEDDGQQYNRVLALLLAQWKKSSCLSLRQQILLKANFQSHGS